MQHVFHMKILTTKDVANGFVMFLGIEEGTRHNKFESSNKLSLFLARVVFAEAISSLNLDEFNSKQPPKYSGMETLMVVQSFAAGSTSFYQ